MAERARAAANKIPLINEQIRIVSGRVERLETDCVGCPILVDPKFAVWQGRDNSSAEGLLCANEGRVLSTNLLKEIARKQRDLDPGLLKAQETLSGNPLVRIQHADKHLADVMLDYQLCTAFQGIAPDIPGAGL